MKVLQWAEKEGVFTRGEIFSVIIILGILAAIVVPQFANASEMTQANRLVSQLQTIRSQLELAQVQHAGVYPDLVKDGWDTLTRVSEQDAAYTAGNSDTNDVGPYLQEAPANPFAMVDDQSSVAADASAAWQYDAGLGVIFAVVPAAKVAELNLAANDAVSP